MISEEELKLSELRALLMDPSKVAEVLDTMLRESVSDAIGYYRAEMAKARKKASPDIVIAVDLRANPVDICVCPRELDKGNAYDLEQTAWAFSVCPAACAVWVVVITDVSTFRCAVSVIPEPEGEA